ncbi:putative peroxisomal biogenesis factor 11 [Helianthus debilis subsp. tardiflorus]
MELALAVLYLNKAETPEKICRAIQDGSKFVRNGEPGTAQNVDKSTSLATKVFCLFKFVNDLHAFISPTAPGTPLPLVLLGKDWRAAQWFQVGGSSSEGTRDWWKKKNVCSDSDQTNSSSLFSMKPGLSIHKNAESGS